MEADALEEKINKIRQKNEEIKRRHEEVEADKQNAAKLNALVQMIPTTVWPERKEPPEFSDPPIKHNVKSKIPSKEQQSEQNNSCRIGGSEGKRVYFFPEGEGPPPDPKYNFLADSERQERYFFDDSKEGNEKTRGKNGKPMRNSFRKRGGGRGKWPSQDQRGQSSFCLDSSHPDYDAWRAERNKIDEARINRQRTAEGSWRREWDNDKMHLVDEISKKESRMTFGDVFKHDYGDSDRHSRGPSKNLYYSNTHSKDSDFSRKMVFEADQNIKTMVDRDEQISKNPVMSVKVSSSNIAGTGRVGPRQRSRMTYCSQSEAESSSHEISDINCQKSFDDKPNYGSNIAGAKSLHHQRKEFEKSQFSSRKIESKSPHASKKDYKSFQKPLNSQMRENPLNYYQSPTAFQKTPELLSNKFSYQSSRKKKDFGDAQDTIEKLPFSRNHKVMESQSKECQISILKNTDAAKEPYQEINIKPNEVDVNFSCEKNIVQSSNDDSGYSEIISYGVKDINTVMNLSNPEEKNENIQLNKTSQEMPSIQKILQVEAIKIGEKEAQPSFTDSIKDKVHEKTQLDLSITKNTIEVSTAIEEDQRIKNNIIEPDINNSIEEKVQIEVENLNFVIIEHDNVTKENKNGKTEELKTKSIVSTEIKGNQNIEKDLTDPFINNSIKEKLEAEVDSLKYLIIKDNIEEEKRNEKLEEFAIESPVTIGIKENQQTENNIVQQLKNVNINEKKDENEPIMIVNATERETNVELNIENPIREKCNKESEIDETGFTQSITEYFEESTKDELKTENITTESCSN